MMPLLVIVIAFIFCLLLVVAGILPRRSRVSAFERQRQQATGIGTVVLDIRRERLLPDVLSLQRVVIALLLVMLVTQLISVFGWLLGSVIAVVVALEYGAIARLRLLQRLSQRLYNRYEASILTFVERGHGVLRLVRSALPDSGGDVSIESREELAHVISQTRSVISTQEKAMLLSSLEFAHRRVSECMIPKEKIDTVAKSELLGPLVLSDLHKTGHSRFPVIDGDIDTIIGVLYVQDLLSLDVKRSMTAEKAMEARVFYIRSDQTLEQALAGFLQTHHQLFIVINEQAETVGMLSLEDTIAVLIGRKMNDEFDGHDDLRTVAKRSTVSGKAKSTLGR